MSTIDPNSSQSAIFAKLGISQTSDTEKAKKDTLGQSDFLKLMTTQLQNQDPFAPMDNGDFHCANGPIFDGDRNSGNK